MSEGEAGGEAGGLGERRRFGGGIQRVVPAQAGAVQYAEEPREGFQSRSRSLLDFQITVRDIDSTMFGWGSSRESSDSAAATETAATPGLPLPPPPANRTLESLVQEELPIQRHSVQMERGMPSCLTLFDQFFLCYCAHRATPRSMTM